MAAGPTSNEASREVGAYGLRLHDVDAARALLVAARPEWPRLRLREVIGSAEDGPERLSATSALLKLRSGGEIRIDRLREEATFVVPREVEANELVHPLLAPVGAVMAYWLERESFHAGAFVVSGRAWGIIGDRGMGKSTAVAQLALAGVPVLADDLVVIEHGQAFAGPRSVDLREDAAGHFGAGEALGVVGARERWRLRLPEIEPSAPLAGWVFLTWGDRVECVSARARDRVMLLHGNRGTSLPPRNPQTLLELASLPFLELRRPRDWTALPDAAQCLLDAIA